MVEFDRAYYSYIHRYIKKIKPKSNICQLEISPFCKNKIGKGKIELANINGLYKKDINDWIWTCQSCHTIAHKNGEHKNIEFQDCLKDSRKNHKHKIYIHKDKELVKLKRRHWRIKNRNKIKVYKKNYWETHPEYRKKRLARQRETNRIYRINNKDKIKEYVHQYNITHREQKKEYYENHKESIIKYKSEWAKKRTKATKILREKYNEEFKSLFKNNNKNDGKARKVLRDNHREEYNIILSHIE